MVRQETIELVLRHLKESVLHIQRFKDVLIEIVIEILPAKSLHNQTGDINRNRVMPSLAGFKHKR